MGQLSTVAQGFDFAAASVADEAAEMPVA